MAETKDKKEKNTKPVINLIHGHNGKNSRYAWQEVLWRWPQWSGRQFVVAASITVGLSMMLLVAAPAIWPTEAANNGIKTVPLNNNNTDNLIVVGEGPWARHIDGVWVDDPAEVNRWPVGIMVENLLSVRPHWGLSDASVIYETLAESGIPRFLVVYDGPGHDVPMIGPVRSARPYYLEWISEYDGLYAHAGGSPQALQSISGLGINAVNGISSGYQYFWRDPAYGAPHNLFTNSEHMGRALRDRELLDKTPTYEPWIFKDDPPLSERPTDDRINPTISFSSASYEAHYEYDTDRNTYRRFNGGDEQIDRNTREPLRVNNIVVVRTPGETSAGEKGRILINVTGEGTALVFRDGTVIEGTWKKPSRLERTRFYDADNEEISL
ncbi:MAG: DUF3048 domain-containing protein, partial [Patescibacteria group bacterium]